MKSINPYTQKQIADYKEISPLEIQIKLQNAEKTFHRWKKTRFENRVKCTLQLAKLLLEEKDKLAKIISLEMGKPIVQSIAEIEKCAWLCRYYANVAEQKLADKIIETEAQKSYIKYEPLGVLLAIMPWNYPFWQYFRFFVPNIIAGNVALLKHASNVCGCSLAIEKIIIAAGFPKYVSQSLLLTSKNTEPLISNPIVKAVSLTGSFSAGSQVAATCGKYIKKNVLELGGNNALIVFEDADIEQSVGKIINARFQNNGQSCIAGKRLLVHQAIYDELVQKLAAKIKKIKYGNPLDTNTEISVLASEKIAIELELQLKDATNKGAKILTGGKSDKAFFEATLVVNVNTNMAIFKEETFGPLLAICSFKNEAEAISLSNQSEFGLGVSIFTKDKKRIERMIVQLEEAAVFVNEFVKSDPRLPFGGIKNSGYGRELSTNALFEFVNIKTIYIK